MYAECGGVTIRRNTEFAGDFPVGEKEEKSDSSEESQPSERGVPFIYRVAILPAAEHRAEWRSESAPYDY